MTPQSTPSIEIAAQAGAAQGAGLTGGPGRGSAGQGGSAAQAGSRAERGGRAQVSASALGAASTSAACPRDLRTRGLRSGYGQRIIVDGVDLEIPTGKVSVIVGANACGKSTLLKTMARILKPAEGAVLLDGRAITEVPTRALARQLGLLPQQPIAPEGITVADLVGRGRHPHQGLFGGWSAADREIVEEALLATGTAELADRSVDELSGGQRQRVWIAMALAQRTDVLLLDEPTTFLDLAHQIEVLDLLTDVNRARGTTIVMVLHDVNLAARYADFMVAMQGGRVVRSGAPGEVLDADLMREVFGLAARVLTDPASGTPLIIPLGRHHIRSSEEISDAGARFAAAAHPGGAQVGPLASGGPGTDPDGGSGDTYAAEASAVPVEAASTAEEAA